MTRVSRLAESPGAAGPALKLASDDWGEPGWQEQAACQYVDPELFFVPKGGSIAPARSICAMCPVLAECGEYALGWPQHLDGIWGGMSERERGRIRAHRQREALQRAS